MIVLQSILLAVHLLAMNLAASGPLGCIFLQWIGRGKQQRLDNLGRRLAVWSLWAFLIGASLGLLGGWVMWLGGQTRFFTALDRVPSKIYFGIWELGFYAVCMLIYIVWWKWVPPRSMLSRCLHTLVGLAAATNLLWHFPALMTALAHLATTKPHGEVLDAAAFRQLIFQPMIMSRWLHVWFASLATTGLVLSWLAQRTLPTDDTDRPSVIAWGGRFALAATLAQLPLGMWLLVSSSSAEQTRLMGGDLWATLLFVSSLLAALVLLHQLSAIALGNVDRRTVTISVVLLVLIVTLMSATLLLARGDSLEGDSIGDRPLSMCDISRVLAKAAKRARVHSERAPLIEYLTPFQFSTSRLRIVPPGAYLASDSGGTWESSNNFLK